MKACLIKRYSSGELHFDDVAEPQSPTAGQVQVKMLGASINPIDQLIVTGYGAPLFNPKSQFPIVLGRDGVGIVLKTGPGVNDLEPGQRVLIAISPRSGGTYSGVVNLPKNSVAPILGSMTDELAAGIGYAGLTALQSLSAAGITEVSAHGQRIVINGASGGVGSIAVVLATAWGASVTGIASCKNHPWLKEMGCHNIVDYNNREEMNRLDGEIFLNFATPGTRRRKAENPLLRPLNQRQHGRKAYVTTVTPLLEKVTDRGVLLGLGAGLSGLIKTRLSSALHRTRYRWVLFKEDREGLQFMADFFSKPGIANVVSVSNEIANLPSVFNSGSAGSKKGKQVFMWESGL